MTHAIAYPSNFFQQTELEVECPSHGRILDTSSMEAARQAILDHEKQFHPRSYQALVA